MQRLRVDFQFSGRVVANVMSSNGHCFLICLPFLQMMMMIKSPALPYLLQEIIQQVRVLVFYNSVNLYAA